MDCLVPLHLASLFIYVILTFYPTVLQSRRFSKALSLFGDDVSLAAHFIQILLADLASLAKTEWEPFFCQRITILCRQMSHNNCPFGFFFRPPMADGGVIIKALHTETLCYSNKIVAVCVPAEVFISMMVLI